MVTDWEELWERGETPWDAGTAPELRAALSSGPLGQGAGARALVVGSGSGWDAQCFDEHGYDVTALDIAPGARAALIDRPAVRRVVADFFVFKPATAFDVIWDYTFLCAIDPAMRGRWAD